VEESASTRARGRKRYSTNSLPVGSDAEDLEPAESEIPSKRRKVVKNEEDDSVNLSANASSEPSTSTAVPCFIMDSTASFASSALPEDLQQTPRRRRAKRRVTPGDISGVTSGDPLTTLGGCSIMDTTIAQSSRAPSAAPPSGERVETSGADDPIVISSDEEGAAAPPRAGRAAHDPIVISSDEEDEGPHPPIRSAHQEPAGVEVKDEDDGDLQGLSASMSNLQTSGYGEWDSIMDSDTNRPEEVDTGPSPPALGRRRALHISRKLFSFGCSCCIFLGSFCM